MTRGPTITDWLVKHLGLSQDRMTAPRNDMGDYLKQRVDIHYALDHEIAEVARTFMASPKAEEYFNVNGLKYQWSSYAGRAEIGRVVREVMMLQQYYVLDRVHRGEEDCPGCRHHPLPSQTRVQEAQPDSLHRANRTPHATTVILDRRPTRPRPTYAYDVFDPTFDEGSRRISGKASDERTDDQVQMLVKKKVVNEQEDPDSEDVILPSSRKRQRIDNDSESSRRFAGGQADRGKSLELGNDTIAVQEQPMLPYTPALVRSSAADSTDVATNQRTIAAPEDQSVSMSFRGKTFHYRSLQHQSEMVGAALTWQAQQMHSALDKAAGPDKGKSHT